jgi:hypothetical protein
MNLREFLAFRSHCPLCNSELRTFFHSTRRQKSQLIDGRLIFFFDLSSLNKMYSNYKVAFSFSLDDDSWLIDFVMLTSSKDNKTLTQIPEWLITGFKVFDENLKKYVFQRRCNNIKCQRYNYTSNEFKLPFKQSKMIDLQICQEYFGLVRQFKDEYKIYKLLNRYDIGESILSFCKDKANVWARDDHSYSMLQAIKLPLIKFSSIEETIDKLETVILFS